MSERTGVALRLGVILVAYALYRSLAEDSVPGALLTAGGALVAAYAVLNRYTRFARKRSEMMEVAGILLGLGLVGAGLLLVLR